MQLRKVVSAGNCKICPGFTRCSIQAAGDPARERVTFQSILQHRQCKWALMQVVQTKKFAGTRLGSESILILILFKRSTKFRCRPVEAGISLHWTRLNCALPCKHGHVQTPCIQCLLEENQPLKLHVAINERRKL